jgi:hypothetical protein
MTVIRFAQDGMPVKSMLVPLVVALAVSSVNDPPEVREPVKLPVTLPVTLPVMVAAMPLALAVAAVVPLTLM